ncbi:MAG: hypothetical protein ACKO0Z_20975 [Betaproteobacteria bacterium]
MALTLIPNWKDVLQKAWSIRFALLVSLFSGIEAALPFLRDAIEPMNIIPPGTFAILAVLASSGVAISRVVAQTNLTPTKESNDGTRNP